MSVHEIDLKICLKICLLTKQVLKSETKHLDIISSTHVPPRLYPGGDKLWECEVYERRVIFGNVRLIDHVLLCISQFDQEHLALLIDHKARRTHVSVDIAQLVKGVETLKHLESEAGQSTGFLVE